MHVVVVDGIARQAATADLLTLAHPSHPGEQSVFFRCDRNLFEIQEMSQGKSSWFVGNSVVSNGSLYVATRIDPLFLALPILEFQAPGCYYPLDQLDDEVGLLRILSSLDHFDLHLICDRRSLDEGDVFRLNAEKVVSWLEAKIRRVQAALMADEKETSSAIATSFLIEAVGIICDYVEPRWTPLLLERFGLASDALDPPRQTSNPAPEPVKKNTSRSTTTSASRKAKRIKADTSSMRSLRSYFAPKS